MKSEKGITLISVIVYLFAMVMALTIVSLISSFFFENIYSIRETGELTSEYNKFNMFFIEDMKNSYDVTYEVINENNSRIQFIPEVGSEERITYSLVEGSDSGNSIYRNNIKIADNIEIFSVTDYTKTYDETSITVSITLTNTTSFSIKYYLGRGY